MRNVLVATLAAGLSILVPYAPAAEVARTEQVGDSYIYRTLDIYSGVEDGRYRWRITGVEADRLIFDDGYWITDRLGNDLKLGIGAQISGMQFFVPELQAGKSWKSAYTHTRADGARYTIEYDFTVVAQEQVRVPAGTFDTWRIEGTGYIHQVSGLRHGKACDRHAVVKLWVAPDRVTRFVAENYTQRGAVIGCSHYYANTRTELVAFGPNADAVAGAANQPRDPHGHHSQIRTRPVTGLDDY